MTSTEKESITMQLQTLQQELASRAISLTLDSTGKLKYSGPKGAMTPELTAAIKENRAVLLASLTTPEPEQETPAPESVQSLLARMEQDGVMLWRELSTGELTLYTTKELQQKYAPAIRALDAAHYYELASIVQQEPLLPGAWPAVTRRATPPAPESNHQPERQDESSTTAASIASTTGPGQTPDTTDTTEESRRSTAKRAVVYADVHAGQAITDAGQTISFTAGCSLPELLRTIQAAHACDRLYICGKLPEQYRAWLTGGMFEEYTTGKRGFYLSAQKEIDYVARYQHRATGQEIEIRTAYSWFGDTEYTVEQAQAAMVLFNQYLKFAFKEATTTSIEAYATPALTFQQCWQFLNRFKGHKLELLPEDIRALIRRNSGQGRIECTALATLDKIPGAYYYDGVFMYSALTWELGTELEAHDNKNEYAGYQPARYRIRYTVPESWQHIGLFMTPKEQITGNERDSDAWCYPGDGHQGQTFEAWAGGSELDALIKYYAPPLNLPINATKEQKAAAKAAAESEGQRKAWQAWNITVLERIVYKKPAESAVRKPLDSITERIARARDKIEQDARHDSDNTRAIIYKLVRGMFRNMLLHGIGSFNRENRDVTYILPLDEAPDGFTGVPHRFTEDLYIYTVPQKTEPYTQQFEHPELSSQVWERCRARVTLAALGLPREQVLAIRTDAIAVTAAQPQWQENEKRGTFREKWRIAKQLKAPHTLDELDKLIHKYVKDEDR